VTNLLWFVVFSCFLLYPTTLDTDVIENIPIDNKILTYNIGEFNETYELYKTLTDILIKHNIYSDELLFLLLGISAVETYNVQYLNNPVARGLFQIEPKTAEFTLKKAQKNEEWLDLLEATSWDGISLRKQLRDNLEYQVIMLYMTLQVKGVNISKLQLNRNNLAEIWKKYWNTYKGKGTTNQFKRRWKELNIDKIKQQHIINNFRNENGKTNKKEK